MKTGKEKAIQGKQELTQQIWRGISHRRKKIHVGEGKKQEQTTIYF